MLYSRLPDSRNTILGYGPMTFDVRSAKVTGAQSAGRARVIWLDGELQGFNREGRLFSLPSEKPIRRPRHIRSWDAQTSQGVVHIDETCWTCNGWLKMAMKSIDDLMGDSE